MEAQTPAEGIMAFKQYKTWRWWRVPCSCGCDSEVDISIEIDEPDDPTITCHISAKVKTAYWHETFPITYDESWIVMWIKETANRVVRTAKICWTAITKGYVEVESYTLLTKQQTLNLAAVLQNGVAEMEAELAKKAK